MKQSPYKSHIIQAIVSKTLAVGLRLKSNSGLLKSGFIIQSSEGYVINVDSKIFFQTIVEVAQEQLDELMPTNIHDAIKFVSKFEAHLKAANQDNVFNAFDFIIKPYNIQTLVHLHKNGSEDIVAFYISLNGKRRERDRALWNYEEYFFGALPYLQLNPSEVVKILASEPKSGEQEHSQHEKGRFITLLPKIDLKQALTLYQYGKAHGLDKVRNFLPFLLAGLHKAGYKRAVSEAKELQKANVDHCVLFFGSISYTSHTLVEYVIGLFKVLTKDSIDACCNYVFTLNKLLTQSVSTKKQIETVFQIYLTMLSWQIQPITNSILNALCWHVEGYEQQRYHLLRVGLDRNLIEPAVINNFFKNFSTPKYFFLLFTDLYSALKRRLDLKLFQDGFSHLLHEHYETTEKEVLELLSADDFRLRTGMLELWLGSHRSRRDLSVLTLESELAQLRVVEVISKYPYGFDDLLPTLLLFRKSRYVNVVQYVQNVLCTLVFEAYHQHGYDLISKSLEVSKEDKIFLRPITKAFEMYSKLRKAKSEIKEIDPRANEKGLVQLYYKLEAERNAKMMNEINKDENSFLGQVKSVIVVRGNAWKLEGQEVAALEKYHSSVSLDSRMFKNPDQFEMSLTFPKNEY